MKQWHWHVQTRRANDSKGGVHSGLQDHGRAADTHCSSDCTSLLLLCIRWRVFGRSPPCAILEDLRIMEVPPRLPAVLMNGTYATLPLTLSLGSRI